ncbi:hypothetical protein JTE90_004439 [Oedothorax gibbosus]|uniref:Uncharacterized protein n=1 Tax=Oedothorax gibbosus TaxID=931172 RepID=A0AAV6UPK0_9ARAC|nr:hypothetical protein JTE90_004439 [Oedothorax gibbosus]
MLELFLQHLPSHVQTVLAAVTPLTLDKAAEIADRVMEVSPIASNLDHLFQNHMEKSSSINYTDCPIQEFPLPKS